MRSISRSSEVQGHERRAAARLQPGGRVSQVPPFPRRAPPRRPARRRAAPAVPAPLTHAPAVQIPPAVRVTTWSADGCLLMHLETLRTCALNAMGARIWALVAQGRAVGDITAALSREYAAPPGQIARDVRAFLDLLVAKGLLTVAGGAGSPLSPPRPRG